MSIQSNWPNIIVQVYIVYSNHFYIISEFHNEEMESMVESLPQKANLRLSKRRKPKPALLRDLQPPTKRTKRRPVYTPSKIIRVTYWGARLVCMCTSALFSEQQVTGLQFEMCQMCWSKSLYKHREIQEYESIQDIQEYCYRMKGFKWVKPHRTNKP